MNMKNRILNSITCFAMLFMAQAAEAQCPNNNSQFGTSNAPSTVGVLTTLSSCMYGGEYRLVNNMQAGSQYSVETCGDSDFDTQITVYDNSTGAVVAYNDDFCGLQSKVTFTSNGNSVRLLVDRYNCSNQSSCMTLRMTRLSGGAPAVDPCNSITALSCANNSGSFSLSGSGAWNGLGGPWSTPGEEQVFSFTPTLSGSHSIAITNSSYYVDLYVKSGSCGSTGWTYIDDISSFGTGTNSVTLTAGVQYYFLIDDENTSASSGTITVNCPTPAVDPCNSITNIAACGSGASYSLSSGNGAWNPPGPWGTPGKEAVFSYTPPTSGAYDIQVLNSGYYVDLFYKTGSCSSAGWTYVSDIFSNETNTVNLVGGVTYLFLIDDENTSASSGSINISCPCIAPPGGVDESFTYNGDFTISGTTVGACDDCNLRSSNDRVYAVTIPCAGVYSFTTCGGASWDTYLYLRTAACGGTSIAINDDACGLQSRVTATLQPGTYYIHVEGWSSSSQGSFNLSVTGTLAAPVIGSVTGPSAVCANGSGAYTVSGDFDTYSWSVPSGATITSGSNTGTISVDFGSSSGYVSVTASNSCGSNSAQALVKVNPNPIADAGSDATVYYGYAPMSCVTLMGSATSGTSPYSYQWSNGDATAESTVCPQTSTDYTLTVTDVNGCSDDDEVSVCVIDVICHAGNSGNEKVEICHTPKGNPGNAHTLCVNADAVPAHLAHGCSLGSCDEQDNCSSDDSAARRGSSIDYDKGHQIEFIVSPNPFNEFFEVDLLIEEEGSYTIDLVNSFGQVINHVYNGDVTPGKHYNFKINSEKLSQGMYFLRAIGNDGEVVLSKIIKM